MQTIAQLINQLGNQIEKLIAPVFLNVIARLVRTVTAPEFTRLVKKCFTQAYHLCMIRHQTKVLQLVLYIVPARIRLF